MTVVWYSNMRIEDNSLVVDFAKVDDDWNLIDVFTTSTHNNSDCIEFEKYPDGYFIEYKDTYYPTSPNGRRIDARSNEGRIMKIRFLMARGK